MSNPTNTSLFGRPSSTPTNTSLFGSSSTATSSTPTRSSLFGPSPTAASSTPTNTSLFGQSSIATRSTATSSSLFAPISTSTSASLSAPSSTLPVGTPRPGTTQQLSAPEHVCTEEQFQSFVLYPPYNDSMSFEEVRFNDYKMRLSASTPASPQSSSPTTHPIEGSNGNPLLGVREATYSLQSPESLQPPNLEVKALKVEQPSPSPANPSVPSTPGSSTPQKPHLSPKTNTDAPITSPTKSATNPKGDNAGGQAQKPFTLLGCPAALAPPILPGLSTRSFLSLLHGPVVKVVVGSSSALCSDSEMCTHVTYLPKALLMYHSPFMKKACSGQFKEAQEKTVRLPQDNPTIFAKFVEWMYYDTYFSGTCLNDVYAWVLGDKLLAVRFMNYAMGKIYATWTAANPSKLDPSFLSHVLNNTMPGSSKLRLLFLDILRTSYTDPHQLSGDTDTWDEVLQKHDDARKAVLEICMKRPIVGTYIKALDAYLAK